MSEKIIFFLALNILKFLQESEIFIKKKIKFY